MQCTRYTAFLLNSPLTLMKIRYEVIFTFLLVFCSCEDSNKTASMPDTIESVDQLMEIPAQKLTGSQTSLLEGRILSLAEMEVFDTLLVIHKLIPDPYYYDIYGLGSEKLLASFGLQGNGPGEFPDFNNMSVLDRKNRLLGVMIPNTGGTLYEVPLDSILNNSTFELKSSQSLGYVYNKNFVRFNDDDYVALSSRSDKRVTHLKSSTEVVDANLSYPFEEEFSDWPRNLLGMIYQGNMVKNDRMNRGAVLTIRSANVDIFDLADSIRTVKQIHLNFPRVFNESGESGNTKTRSVSYSTQNEAAFISAKATSEYIYALYSGRSYSEYGGRDDFGTTVFVIDWEGNFIKRIELDEDTNAIAVSPDNTFLFSLVEYEQYNVIRKYKLPL